MPEKVALVATIFREIESRPLPVMARVIEREQIVGKAMGVQVIPDRMAEETPEEVKTVHLTDPTVSLTIEVQDLHPEQTIQVNRMEIQGKELIVDKMKGLPVVHQTAHLADRKDLPEIPMKDPSVVVLNGQAADHQIAPLEDQKDLREIPMKDPIAVVLNGQAAAHQIARSADQKDHQVIQVTDLIAVRRNVLPVMQMIAPSTDPIANLMIKIHGRHLNQITQVNPMVNPDLTVNILNVQAVDHQIVRSTDLQGLQESLMRCLSTVSQIKQRVNRQNVLLADQKNPPGKRTKSHFAVNPEEQLEMLVTNPSKDQKDHFAIRKINHVATG